MRTQPTPYRHAIQHLKECADDAFGKDMKDGRKWFDRFRGILLDDAKGVGRTIDAIHYLINSFNTPRFHRPARPDGWTAASCA